MRTRVAFIAVLAMAPLSVAACTSEQPSTASTTIKEVQTTASTNTTSMNATTAAIGSTTASASGVPSTDMSCYTGNPVPPQGPSTQLTVLSEGDTGQPRISAAVYPKPQPPGKLWSQWGQGVVLPDGRFLSAAGTHDGAGGNSYLFVLDTATGTLTQFSDVLSVIPHQPGDWGYGKIHGQLVRSGCDVIAATYWGDRDGLTYTASYTGDHLLSIDPNTYAVTDLGVPIARHGLPSIAGGAGLIYGEAVDPLGRGSDGDKSDVGTFFAYDPAARKVVYRSDDQRHRGFRNVAVTSDGAAYVAGAGTGLMRYQPGGALQETAAHVPEGWLRASTAPAADGRVYAVTRAPEHFFALAPDGRVTDLGPAPGYIASLALSADGREVLFVPDAHGVAWEKGTPLMALDPSTRKVRTIVELEPLIKQHLGLVAGGSYNIAVDPDSGRIFVGLNAGPDPETPWGDVVLAVIEP